MAQGRTGNGKGMIGIIWAASLVATAVAVFFATSAFLGSDSGTSGRKQLLVQEMRLNLARTSDREKSAVLAQNDEDSINFADEARSASDAVERDRRALARLLAKEGSENERALLDKFDTSWATLRQADATLLESAGQNTNRRAIELSETICDDLLQKFQDDLSKLTQSVNPPARRIEMQKLAGQAGTSALRIALLQLRHISAPSAPDKATIETSMKNEARKVSAALATLESMTGKKSSPFIRSATSGFSQYLQVNDEIVRLSNIRATVGRSIEERRTADAACDRLLRELGAAGQKNSR